MSLKVSESNPEKTTDSFAIAAERKAGFVDKVLAYYKAQGRVLPWRSTTDPYAILVSEVMLQQTQVDRVVPYYHRFLEHFPTPAALAAAGAGEVLSLWSGLGFNSRALRLKAAAEQICRQWDGRVPCEYQALRKLPGLGDYTACAILAFAYNLEVAVVDTNIRRVLIAEFELPADMSAESLKAIALELVPAGKSRDWHNALMDYGSQVLSAKATGISPLSKQSKFEGSNRQIRGAILKAVLGAGSLPVAEAHARYGNDKTSDIIAKMEQDGLLRIKGELLLPP